MTRVSFKVAKALKEAGYPQKCNVHIPYYDKDGNYHYGSQIGCPDFENNIYAPTYIDVWLWLWREKRVPINVDYSFTGLYKNINDPEEAIIAYIEAASECLTGKITQGKPLYISIDGKKAVEGVNKMNDIVDRAISYLSKQEE